MECVETWTGVVQNICVAVASIAGICFGWVGLRTWREQLLGTRAYELARRLMLAALAVREKIARARNSFITPDEMWSALKASGLTDEEARQELVPGGAGTKMLSAVYHRRWNEVADSMTELRAAFLEAEALWGSEVVENLKPISRCASTLRKDIMLYLRYAGNTERNERDHDRREALENSIWDLSEDGNPDAIASQVNEAVDRIADLTRSHLRR